MVCILWTSLSVLGHCGQWCKSMSCLRQYWIYMFASKVFVFFFLWWIQKQNSCSKTTAAPRRWGEDNLIDFSSNVIYNHIYQFHMKWCISMSPTPNYLPEGTNLLKIEGKKNIFRLCVYCSFVWIWLIPIWKYDITLAYNLRSYCCMWSSVQSDRSCETEACECTDLRFDVLALTSSLPTSLHWDAHAWDQGLMIRQWDCICRFITQISEWW